MSQVQDTKQTWFLFKHSFSLQHRDKTKQQSLTNIRTLIILEVVKSIFPTKHLPNRRTKIFQTKVPNNRNSHPQNTL